MNSEAIQFPSIDGIVLEGELAIPDNPQLAVVLSHPHPKHGGNMKSIIPSALFASLPENNVAVLRFNFRGIGNSQGEFGGGVSERGDLIAAIDQLNQITEGLPLIVAGWSFGADTSLCIDDSRISAWFLVAPPLREQYQEDILISHDPRLKQFVIPGNDQFRPPQEVKEITKNWINTKIEIIPGADHFMVGRTDRVVELCISTINQLREI